MSPNEPPERYILGGKREQQSSPKTNTIPADRYLLARETETAIIAKTNPYPADFRFLARGEILRRKELALASRPNDISWEENGNSSHRGRRTRFQQTDIFLRGARETEIAIIAKTNPNLADFRFLARGEILRRKELALAS